jgi:hypothetical protein
MSDPRESRIATGQCVQITVLGERDQPIPATVKNVSGRGLGLELTRPLDTGTAVKVVLDDAMLLGETIYCRNQGATWYLGVELEQGLYGLAELASALSSFREPDLGPEQPHTAKHARHEHQ